MSAPAQAVKKKGRHPTEKVPAPPSGTTTCAAPAACTCGHGPGGWGTGGRGNAHPRTGGQGSTLKGLPALFGLAAEEFKRWMDDDPGLRKAYDKGKEEEREALHRTLYEAATYKCDLNAAQFLLKTRHGYRETALPSAPVRPCTQA